MVEWTIEAEAVAAMIVEPTSVSSPGFVVPGAAYLRALRAACDRHNVLLIYDEIITGFGGLEEWFGADHHGVAPDLLCCGKGVTGAYAPLTAVLIADRVWQASLGKAEERREFHHGHTFGGNPVAAAVGVAAIEEIESQGLMSRAHTLGAPLRGGLKRVRDRFPDTIGDVRRAGLLQGFEFSRASFPVTAKPGKRFESLARGRGLLARCGADYVVVAPPLDCTGADLEALVQIADACLEEMA